ncbi:MAG: hypothetical protein IT516_12365 [Burkholderiales bacterium]|nr:hypothetical protein [Burkholderiales bacterium]
MNRVITAINLTRQEFTMKVQEAIDAINQVGDEQAAAKDVLLQEVAKVGDAVNGLEQQLRDALEGALSAEQEAAVNAALERFRGNTQAITDAAAAVKAGTDDATDGTST